MIFAQEQAFLKARQQLQAIEAFVDQAATAGQRIDNVERELFAQLLSVGLTLLEAFVAAQGDGNIGAWIKTDAGRTIRRLKEPHMRRYLSIFGELLIRRCVYAQREKQRIERGTRRTPGPSRRRVLVRVGRLASTTVREGVVSGRPDVATHPVGRGSQPTGHRADEPTHGPGSRSAFARSMSSRRRTKKQRCWWRLRTARGTNAATVGRAYSQWASPRQG